MSSPIEHRRDGGDVDAPPARRPVDSELQSEALASLASVRNYHAWLTGLALPYLGDHPLELGSGLGDYAQAWLDAGVPRLTLTELDRSRSAFLRSRFENESRIDVRPLDILDPPEARYSSLVAFKVLEHIEDHVGALRASHRLLVPGGAVIVFVPAFRFAMGRFDRRIGHFRRYTKQTLHAAYEEAGLEVETIRYVNAPGCSRGTSPCAYCAGRRATVRRCSCGIGPSRALARGRAPRRPAVRPVRVCGRAGIETERTVTMSGGVAEAGDRLRSEDVELLNVPAATPILDPQNGVPWRFPAFRIDGRPSYGSAVRGSRIALASSSSILNGGNRGFSAHAGAGRRASPSGSRAPRSGA